MSDGIEQRRDIPQGDYDSRADKLWSVYNKEAESYDKALMETWKGDMDSLIIFAGLFSAVLTAFLVDASKKLKTDPTDQTNALLNQTVFLLAQISHQLGPNGSQTVISLPPSLEPFKLNPSDLHVNIFWFMSLAFSIFAALWATLVQQWIRDYLQIFQQFSGSLERSRMRQFLFHGLSSNHMHMLVECVPTFIHISLFLFFIGLAENLFDTNGIIAITMTTIICIGAFLYWTYSILPVLYTKTPYHTPLSNVCWKMGQIISPRKYSDENTGRRIVPVSSDMAKGRFQLAMRHSDDRMTRDTEAIHWLLTKVTEDSEFEPFLSSIGGSLATPWGRDVWRRIFKESPGNTEGLTHSGTITTSNVVQALKIRIESLLHSYTVSTSFDPQARFTRACVCIDAVASLTLGFEAGSELDINYGLINTVLQYFGDGIKRWDKLVQETQTSSGSLRPLPNSHAMDISLEIKWKCLVLIGMKKALQNGRSMATAVEGYGRCVSSKQYRIVEGEAITNRAHEVDYELLKAWNAARQLYLELRKLPEESFTEDILLNLVPHWRDRVETMQESLNALNLRVESSLDSAVLTLSYHLNFITGSTLEHLSIISEWPSMLTAWSMFEGIDLGMVPSQGWHFKCFMPHLIPPRLLICHLLICADPRRRPDFNSSTSKIDLVGLGRLLHNPEMHRLFDTPQVDEDSGLVSQSPQPYVNQFWRIQDIGEHGGVGFMLEMFFATFRSLEEPVTLESIQMIKATLREIAGGGRSVYFKAAGQRFLWALRQALYTPRSVDGAEVSKTPPNFLVKMLKDLFSATNENRPEEKREEKIEEEEAPVTERER